MPMRRAKAEEKEAHHHHDIGNGGGAQREREGGVEEDSASEEDWASQAFDFVAVGGLRNLTQLRAGLLRSLLSYLLWSGECMN